MRFQLWTKGFVFGVCLLGLKNGWAQKSEKVSFDEPTPIAIEGPVPIENAPPTPEQQANDSTLVTNMSEPKTHGVFGQVLVGPTVSLFAVPSLIRFGVESQIYGWVGISADYGFIPKLKVSGVSVQATASSAAFRFYPFQRAFFVGVGFGTQYLKAQKTEKIQGVDVTGTLEVNTPFFTPQAGWRWVWNSGFMMGMELGYQIPQSTSVSVKSDVPTSLLNSPQYLALEADIKKAGDQIGEKALPHFALLQLGYFF